MAMACAVAVSGSCGRLGFELLPSPNEDASTPDAPDGRDADLADVSAEDVSVPPDGRVEDARLDSSAADAARDSSAADAALPSGNFCEQIPRLPSAPVIDGVMDPGVPLRRIVPVGWTGTTPIPADHEAAYAIGWLPDGLYFFVEVRDTTRLALPSSEFVHCGDAVELYVDSDGAFPTAPKYDVPGTIQFVIGAPANATDPMRRAQRWNNVTQLQGDWTSTRFVAVPTSAGYTVEAVVVAADLGLSKWSLAAAATVALALAIDLSDPAFDAGGSGCPARLGQYFNRVASGSAGACGPEPFCSTNAFCTVPLL